MVVSSDGVNHWEYWTEQEIMEERTEIEGVLRKHWSDSVVITDDIKSAKEYMKKVAETELWQGELGAYTLKVGCYLVRIAERLYSIYEPGYIPEMEQPISREDTEAIKKERSGCGKFGMLKNVRFTSELSARHCDAPKNDFTIICRSAHARDDYWSESLKYVCAAKENRHIPDEYASLIAVQCFSGSSWGSRTFFKYEPTGRVTRLEI